jgi:hypothetical protein
MSVGDAPTAREPAGARPSPILSFAISPGAHRMARCRRGQETLAERVSKAAVCVTLRSKPPWVGRRDGGSAVPSAPQLGSSSRRRHSPVRDCLAADGFDDGLEEPRLSSSPLGRRSSSDATVGDKRVPPPDAAITPRRPHGLRASDSRQRSRETRPLPSRRERSRAGFLRVRRERPRARDRRCSGNELAREPDR